MPASSSKTRGNRPARPRDHREGIRPLCVDLRRARAARDNQAKHLHALRGLLARLRQLRDAEPGRAHNVAIEDNRFHDCRGCDFIHGRFGSWLTIRRNRFDRALPCHTGRYRCGHNDLVQLFAGQWLCVEDNKFGVYRDGGAQLYLTDDADHATIVNNVFVGKDPRVPGYRARMAIVVGANESKRLPYYAKIVNNTILTGYRRRDGYAGSIRMSSMCGGIRRWKRPIVANNVIALLQTSWRVCAASQRFLRNIVMDGKDCTADNYAGPVDLDHLGRPLFDSIVIGLANRHYAPANDITGRHRDPQPDVGAYEYRAGK